MGADPGYEEKYGEIFDVHAHVLPGVDDGAEDMDEAERLLLSAASQGVREVIATPHYSRRRGTDRERLQELAVQLQERMSRHDPQFRVYLGQETYYHEELPERLKEGQALTMAGSRYVLMEFDTAVLYTTLSRGVRRLAEAGYVPVLAHMERYRCLRDEDRIRETAKYGCVMQMNYDSIRGHWFQPEVRWCRKQVLDGTIQLLGTDMHRRDFRPPEITEAVRWLSKNLSRERFEDLTYLNARRMTEDEAIPL